MAELLNSILNVTKVFQKYAQENGDCASLCKKELKQLLYAEFGDILRRPNDPQTVDNILNLLDQDRNGQVDFHEYLLLVFQLAEACHRKLGNDSCENRCCQPKRRQERNRDRQFPENTGKQHSQQHEWERQNSCQSPSERQKKESHYSQSERQGQDSHCDQSEKQNTDSFHGQPEGQDQEFPYGQCKSQDRDFHHAQSRRQDKNYSFDQGEDSSSGQKMNHKSSRGQHKLLRNINASNQCEKPAQDSHYGQLKRLGQQSSHFGSFRPDASSCQTNQWDSGSRRLGKEADSYQRHKQGLDSQHDQTDNQGQSSHYSQTDTQRQSTCHGRTDTQGHNAHHSQTDTQGHSTHHGQKDIRRQSARHGQTDTRGHREAQTRHSEGEEQSHQTVKEQGHPRRSIHSHERHENPHEVQHRTPEEEQNYQRGHQQTHKDEQNHQRQDWQTYKEFQNYQPQQGRQNHEDEHNHKRQDRKSHEENRSHQQQWERQSWKKEEKHQESQDPSKGTQGPQQAYQSRDEVHNDKQSWDAQGTHSAWHLTQSSVKPQTRQQSASDSTKKAVAPNPFYNYVQEQKLYQC
ncbi:repetin [Ochotona princeps]|uniref:repetin n=1 Tax=Ochotona princeps TaxID=9978 RepID=UPI002714C107|nr:repetin [Ochotona princeps]